MKTTMLCLLNSEELASKLGKKGTESDITLYNHKKGETALAVAVPTRYPEKLSPLLFSLYLGDEVILVIDRLDKEIGEMLVACDIMGKKGTLILENYMQLDQIKPIIKDTTLENWDILEGTGDPNVMRESLMERKPAPRDGPTKISVDHSFTVKGLGTVSLGIVDRGIVKKHQEVIILPSGEKTIVRSIQMHDDDVNEAGSGSRVGLALKNVEPEDVGRGCVLTEAGHLSVADSLTLKVKISKFWRDTLKDGMVLHLASGMQFVPGTVSMTGELKAGETGEIQVKLDGQMVLDSTDTIVVNWLESTGPRILGSAVPVQ
ncbi:MAG: elongation factor Tu [Thermoplasmata archaeon]|nr:elongation factor Tu [Thermoplasmata archaeon]